MWDGLHILGHFAVDSLFTMSPLAQFITHVTLPPVNMHLRLETENLAQNIAMEAIGTVSSVIGGMAVIQGSANSNVAVDSGSVFWTAERQP